MNEAEGVSDLIGKSDVGAVHDRLEGQRWQDVKSLAEKLEIKLKEIGTPYWIVQIGKLKDRAIFETHGSRVTQEDWKGR